MDIVLLTSVIVQELHSGNDKPFKPVRGLGAYQLAWHLRNYDYDVQVIDFIQFYSNDEIMLALDRYIDQDTRVVGLGLLSSTHLTQFFARLEDLLIRVKQEYPWVTIVGGGPSSGQYNVMFKRKVFDYIITGYAEDNMLALCNYICKNKSMPRFEIDGNGNKILREGAVVDVPKFNIESCHHTWHARDFIQPKESLPLETTRGCIFKCKFCAYPHIGKHKRDFLRSIDCIKNELIHNYENYQITNYSILDDTFNSDVEKLEEFVHMTQSLPFKINYATYLRLDLIEAHRHTEDMLLESGLIAPYFGIESLNPAASKLIGKSFSGKNAREYLPYLIHDAWKDRMLPHCGLIAGLPPETYKDLEDTDQWFIDNDLYSWSWNGLAIRVGTQAEHISEFERNYEKYGFRAVPHNTLGTVWETDYSNGPLAFQWGLDLNDRSWQIKHLGAFQVFDRLTLGYDVDTIKNNTYLDWQQDLKLVARKQQWVRKYWHQIMNQ